MYCWVCDQSVDAFLPYGLPPRPGRCPHCGAKPRHRGLKWFMHEHLAPRLGTGTSVLEVGATALALRHLHGPDCLGQAAYTAADIRALPGHALLSAPHGAVRSRVEALSFADQTFDVLLCNNVLVYVADYPRALRELRRCLKPDGLALLDVHREPGPTVSAAQYRQAHPELDDEFFAVNGDTWVFGEDYPERVREAGLLPRTVHLFDDRDAAFRRENGLKRSSSLLVAARSQAGLDRFLPNAESSNHVR